MNTWSGTLLATHRIGSVARIETFLMLIVILDQTLLKLIGCQLGWFLEAGIKAVQV
jgi:hypothetical protein